MRHHPEEPSYSILRRTLERNAISHPGMVYSALGRHGGMSVTSLPAGIVARMCHVDAEALTKATPTRSGPAVELFGHRLAFFDVSVRKGRRWCPSCIAEEAVHRAWWDLEVIACCPRHLLAFASKCRCGLAQYWGKERIAVCACGIELADAAVLRVSSETARASGYILSRLLGETVEAIPMFEGVGVGESVEVMRRLGAFTIDPWAKLDHVVAKRGITAVLNVGLEAAATFPESFRSALDAAMANADTRPGSAGVRRAYGDVLYAWLKRRLDTKTGSLLAAEMREHAKGKVLRKQGALLLGKSVSHDRVSVLEASKLCGLSFARMRRIAVARGLVSPDASAKEHNTLSLVDLVTIKRDLGSYIGSTDLARLLNVKHEDLLEIVAAGHIPVAHPPRDIMRVQTKDAFRSDAAEDLLNRLGRGQLPEGVPAGTVTLTLAASRIHISTAEIVGRVLAGEIQPLAFDSSAAGLRAFRIRATGWRAKLRKDRLGLISAMELADIVGCHTDVASRLGRVGAIPSVRVGRLRMLVESDGLAFFERHLSSAEVAARFGVPVRDAKAFLAGRGVEPAWRKEDVGKWLFDRGEVERLPAASTADRKGRRKA
ncbi:TniQ family protein [Aurantimonas sp. A2-1-M11]|uniref:TniQ family protein n=1 Tax=Aurantimonas sp. A2-1-M11 TaxID=3113712 RepID=UPI002F91CC5F